jgi:(p)ppGpp synthase/HD superfamily hydrolase
MINTDKHLDYDKLLPIAKKLATVMHYGQVDKVGEPYMNHVNRVGGSVLLSSNLERIVGYLHDIIEDTNATFEFIADRFGLYIATLVDNVTKRDGESTEDYFKRVNSDLISARVKFADTNDNINRSKEGLDEATIIRLKTKYIKYLDMNIYKGV